MAVALKYDREKDNAPKVVAKGMRFKAEQIRKVAEEHGVPVLKNIPLANALMRVEVGHEIPDTLYDAVAEVLNFVYALQNNQTPRAAENPSVAPAQPVPLKK